MKQIVFVSGKGGTGKSTIVASLSLLVPSLMLADCDVDAPDLHLLVTGCTRLRLDFSGSRTAWIDPALCSGCGSCIPVCRFGAIGSGFSVDPVVCEGCAACTVVCPSHAIELKPMKTGETFVTQTDRGTFSHAQLGIGADGSGKLVTAVRQNLGAYRKQEEWVLIDGSPGIGCAVIASITGTDAAVVVTEPTPSGRHDLARVLSVAKHFQVPAFVCINKFDLNPEESTLIENDCLARGIPVIGRIPFDPAIVAALQQGKTPVEAGLKNIVQATESMWHELVALISTNLCFR